jgi:hypothetical protein
MGEEKKGEVTMSFEGAMCLPWSLRSVAGAPRTARKTKPATPVGMTESEKSIEEKNTG